MICERGPGLWWFVSLKKAWIVDHLPGMELDHKSSMSMHNTIWKDRDDFLHFFLESDLQYSIRFVNDECFEITENKSFGILLL